MTTTRTRAQIGKTNRDAGAQAEQDFAGYLRPRGWPDAERRGNGGWKSGDRESHDRGDIQRRTGKAHPGQWWAHLTGWDLHALVVGEQRPVSPRREFTVPVRLLVRDLIPILHAAGYGNVPKGSA